MQIPTGPILPTVAGSIVMMGIGLALCYVAIKKGYEPLLLLPIGFGALLVNLPGVANALISSVPSDLLSPFAQKPEMGNVFYYIYNYGILTELLPCFIFIAIGAMCDFGALLERPWLLIFAAAGQMGIFIALMGALAVGFNPWEASSIGIIGAMDGPTAIYVTTRFAPHIFSSVVVCAYTYMAMVPIFQVPISKALTTRKERLIRMPYKPEVYPKLIRLIFPVVVTAVTILVAPRAAPLIGCLMFGNFMRESGVVGLLVKSAQNELSNLVTLFLGFVVGSTMVANLFLTPMSLVIFGLGILAFCSALACGILFAKLACAVTKGKVNPLLGACGVSAYPMAARTAHMMGRKEDPDNWLLMHAVATNTGGQIASVVAGGIVLTFAPILLGA